MTFCFLADCNSVWRRLKSINHDVVELYGMGRIEKVERYTKSAGLDTLRIASTRRSYVIHVKPYNQRSLNLFKLKHFDVYQWYLLQTREAELCIADEAVWIYHDNLPMELIEANI